MTQYLNQFKCDPTHYITFIIFLNLFFTLKTKYHGTSALQTNLLIGNYEMIMFHLRIQSEWYDFDAQVLILNIL